MPCPYNFLCFILILGIFLPKIYCLTNSTLDENGKLIIEVDKSGEWSRPIEVPSTQFRLDWIDEECCWKSKLAIDLIGHSPPYLAVPFGRMKVGELIDIEQLWLNTLADYRTKLEEMAKKNEGKNENIEEDGNGSVAKRNIVEMKTIRLSANCPIRIGF